MSHPALLSIPLLTLFAAMPVLAEDTAEKAGNAVERAAEKTGAAVEKAAEKAGRAAVAGKREVTETGAAAGQAVQDAWIDGKLEATYALNGQLQALDIETDVERGVVTLRGTVANRVERDLANEIARGVEGVQDVVNELEIDPAAERTDEPGFGQWVADATTTAMIKSKLLANEHTGGLAIEVDTLVDIVTLSGQVDSAAERDLAGQIAAETGDVKKVRNNLEVRDM